MVRGRAGRGKAKRGGQARTGRDEATRRDTTRRDVRGGPGNVLGTVTPRVVRPIRDGSETAIPNAIGVSPVDDTRMRIVLLANESCLCSLARCGEICDVAAVDRGGPTVSSFSLGVAFFSFFPFLPSLFYFSVVLLVLSVITLPRYVHESFLSPSLYIPGIIIISRIKLRSPVWKHPRNLYLSVYISGDKRSPCNRFSCVVKLRHG